MRLAVSFLFAVVLWAQPRPFSGAPDLEHSLRKLNELGSVMMIAAHPDDERTGVLAYFARGRHMRTAYLSLTRGEGGQNLIGPEQGAALGVIRTQELLAARKIDGAEQFFTRAIDFGFTRTAAETFEKWGRQRILADVVWVIRQYRPDVIVLVFSGTPRDGHGQHQVSAILGKEAFQAAGDAARFPEQLQWVQPWQAKRIVRAEFPSNFVFPPGAFPPAPGGRGGQPARPFFPPLPEAGSVETGDFNPVLGYSYEELAVISRSLHHSQGTGAMRRPGPVRTDFGLVAGDPAANDPFDGIDTSWNRIKGGGPVGAILSEAIRTFDVTHPSRTIPLLAKARPLVAALPDPLAKLKLAELDDTIAQCAGLFLEAQAGSPQVVPGGPFTLTATALNRSPEPVRVLSANIQGIWNQALEMKPATLGYNQEVRIPFQATVPPDQDYSQPYWLREPAGHDVYLVEDQRLVGLADTPPAASVRWRLEVAGVEIELARPVHYRYAERSEGERIRPLAVVPRVAVNPTGSVAVFPDSAPRAIHVVLSANTAKAAGTVRLDAPPGWKVAPRDVPIQLDGAGEEREAVFQVAPPAGESIADLRAVANVDGRDIADGVEIVSYPHFPVQTLFPPARIKLVRANIRVSVHRVGYIMGAGDEMPGALRQMGLEVALLSPADLAQGDLSRFEAIVAGVRAYNVRADVRANHARLMDYVKNGGTYIVQYNTGDAALQAGPYPFTTPPGNAYRVTVEEAPVQFPHPDSPLLRTPNRIEPGDFDGWVQERGLYFANQWDKRYETVFSCHDPGEPPLEGGELWTRYGKGVYIFTAYSWFRQLPAGVPGAYRLFANMLSAK
ncbi:MAG: PIG-L family deacetylase [Bryobacteraceae bacterium]